MLPFNISDIAASIIAMSIDATFSVQLTEFGYQIYCASNVSVILRPLNYAKNIQIPAFLHTLSWYVHEHHNISRQSTDVGEASTRKALDDIQKMMVSYCRRLRKIRLTFAWTQKGRVRSKASREKFEYDSVPLLCGKPHPGASGPWDKSDHTYVDGWSRQQSEILTGRRQIFRACVY